MKTAVCHWMLNVGRSMLDDCALGIQEIGGYVPGAERPKGREGEVPAIEDFLRQLLNFIGGDAIDG
jgi:hypothetical protein